MYGLFVSRRNIVVIFMRTFNWIWDNFIRSCAEFKASQQDILIKYSNIGKLTTPAVSKTDYGNRLIGQNALKLFL